MYDDEAVRTDLSQIEPFRIYRGEVLNTVAALADELFAKLPQLDDDDDPRGLHEHGPCLGWDKRSDGAFPSAGDAVTVFVDDTGDYWVVNWDPNA
jgi:hypothetical protein